MKTLILSFGADGNANCLHTDALPLAELGQLSVRRASKVEFNDATQQWEVRWPDQPEVAFSSASRAECIAFEITILNALLAEGQTCPTYEHPVQEH